MGLQCMTALSTWVLGKYILTNCKSKKKNKKKKKNNNNNNNNKAIPVTDRGGL
jgi:hypothetical protein